jgi:hypothetical protein
MKCGVFMAYKPISIEELTLKAMPVFEKYEIRKAAVFGSCSRGEMIRGSDVDLLIDLGDMKSGLVFVELKRKLERKLGRKVDLVSYGSLNYSRNRASILSQAKVIYER